MRIYIPTFGRADKQITIQNLPPRYVEKTWFVIRESEVDAFSHYPRVIVCPKKGVPAARQTIIEYEEEIAFMFDDDLKFAKRTPDWTFENPKLVPASPEDVGQAIDQMVKDLREESHLGAVGFGARGFNNGKRDHPYRENDRMMMAFAVYTPLLKELGIRFDKFDFWEDFHVALELMKHGFKNRIYTKWVQNATTNSSGGVSTYRNRARLTEVRKEFVKYHAPYVTPVEKSVEGWANVTESTMPDVRIDWRKV